MLSDKEQKAIEVLKECGWQVITGAHLEDWDEGQTIKVNGEDEGMAVRSNIAIIKV